MSNFKKMKLKYISNIYNGNSIPDDQKDYYQEKSIPYIPTKELDLSTGRFNYENGLSVDEDDGFRFAEPNSTIMCIEGGSAGKKIGITDRKIAFVNKLCCIKSHKIDDVNLFYCLQSQDFLDQFYLNMTGLIGGVSISTLKNLTITINEDTNIQKKIGHMIGKKCNKINQLIYNQEQQIEKLKQYKHSLITEVVTKGLNYNVEMKESGVKWIGEIPKNWRILKARRFIETTQNGLTRRDLSISEGNLVLKLKNITPSGLIDYSFENRIKLSDDEIKRYRLFNNDLLFVRVNGSKQLVGKCAIFKEKDEIIAYNDHIIRVRLNELINCNYFYWYLLSDPGKIEIDKYTSTAAGQFTISGEGLRQILTTLPSKEEQNQIVEFLDKKVSQIENLIQIKNIKIEKLNKYKKSLIYEYVTGKREVS